MSQAGDVQKVIRNAITQGFKYSKTSGGHHQLLAPNGHDIIHHSGTPSDHRGFYNFIAQLKRAGYMELQTLGDAMPQKISEGPKLTVKQYVIDLLARHPEGLQAEDISAYIHTVRPDVAKSAFHSVMYPLLEKGVVEKLPSGIHKLKDASKAGKPRKAYNKIKASVPHVKEDVPVLEKKKTPISKEIQSLDHALNDALNALTKIDAIVTKLKEKVSRYAQIEALLK